jgi:hypothetical protein
MSKYRLHRLMNLAKLLIEYRYRIPKEHFLPTCTPDTFTNYVFDCIDNVLVKQDVRYFPIELIVGEDNSCLSVYQDYEVDGNLHRIFIHFCTNGKAIVVADQPTPKFGDAIDLVKDQPLLYSILLERINSVKIQLSTGEP